jgi:uncharacterized protein (DUF927 family)/5S rRNA maturation endonuclease (ribonuclease M5)
MIPDLSPAEIQRYYGLRAQKLHQVGSQLRGPCKLHGGTHDSLAVDPETGHWCCHSKCGCGGSIFDFEARLSGLDFKHAREEVFRIVGRSSSNGTSKRIAATYDYTDEAGVLLYQTVRYDPKEFKQRRPDGKGGWIWNLRGVRLVLYRLPAVLAAPVVFVVEGEKDADALTELGVVVTTSPLGALKWKSKYSEFLRGKEVIMIPDADDKGRNHAANVTQSLAGIAASVKLVELPSAKDSAEWIAKGGTLEALVELTEHARECHVNGHPMPEPSDANASNAPADNKKTGPGFVHRGGGVFWVDDEADVCTFICSELSVEARTSNIDGEFWGRLLVWRDGHGREHRVAVPMELFAGDGVALREILLSGGVEIGAGRRARDLLSQYIQSEHPGRSCVCVPRVGWHQKTFAFPDSTIPRTSSTLFQARERIEHAWRTAGTLTDWNTRIGTPCRGNSRLVFAASMPFGAALLEPLKVEGGGFHVNGDTSTGKTTAQTVAGSVSGGGGRGFVRSWRTTANALESVAELHNHALLTLDELSEMPDPAQVNPAIYMLSNGQGKSRATGSAALRPIRSWLLLFLSSGEITLSEHAQAARVRTRGGGEVRLLNVPADAGAGMGIFENLHGAASAREFADQLKTAAGEVYGTPLRAFLERWTADWDANCAKVKRWMDEFLAEALDAGAAPEVGRAMRRIALIAAAGELAAAWGITGWPEGEARRAARRIASDWIAARGGIGQADVEAGIREVRLFIAAKGITHFQALERRFDNHGNPVVERIVERAGFWQEDKDGERVYLIFPGVFREICPGRNSRAVLKELLKRNLLEAPDAPDHWTKKVRVPNEGTPRFYAIRAAILEGGNEA